MINNIQAILPVQAVETLFCSGPLSVSSGSLDIPETQRNSEHLVAEIFFSFEDSSGTVLTDYFNDDYPPRLNTQDSVSREPVLLGLFFFYSFLNSQISTHTRPLRGFRCPSRSSRPAGFSWTVVISALSLSDRERVY